MAAAFNLTAQINLQGPGNLKPIVSKIKKELGSIKTTLNLDIKPGTAKNIGQITRSLNNLSKAATNANNSIVTLNSTLSALSSSFTNTSSSTSAALNSFGNVSKTVKGTTKAIHESRTAIEEFGRQSGLAIKRFAAFSVVSTVIYGVVNALSSGFKEFVNFNKEIVRLSQVTNKSVSDLKGVTDEITRLSTGLGVASSDLLTVTTTLAQAGFTAEETKIALEALAKSALAPSFENLTSTTEGAIAAMRQFGIQAGELDDALGSINAVAAAFAVEASDIIAAIQRTGGVFAASSRGVSEGTDALNEFIAVFTSVRATTRESAETIATGLRTIFTRIQRSSTIQLLKDYGIELRDLEGKFVGSYEAVKRLSEGLSKIDPRSAAFAAISEELGGFRQIGKVIPLLQQLSVSQDALNVAQRGQKSLARDAVTAQQSLAVQFTKTRENFLALIRDIGDTGTFKAFVVTTLTLANALITLGGALKPLLPLLITFTGIKLASSLKQYSSGFLGALGGGGGLLGGLGVGGPGPSSGGGGPTGKTATLSSNTTALTTLNTSILALNQNIVNTNSLLINRPPAGGKFASGGLVPGVGNSDTYGAMLTPGEFVIRKKAVEKIGVENLAAMNRGGTAKKKKRAYVFDFDDTLAESDAKVMEGAPDPFVDFRGRRGASFIRSATATKYADMAKKRASNGFDIHVLTARPAESETIAAIQEFMLKAIGSQAASVIGVGDRSKSLGGTAKAKAMVLNQFKDAYEQIIFLDDSLENILAARQIGGVRARVATKNNGGLIQRFAGGRGVKGRRGTRSKFRELSTEELSQLSTEDMLKYGRRLARDIFTTGGAGIATSSEFIEVPESRIIPELESSLVTYMGKRGYWREKISPFGRLSKTQMKNSSKANRESSLKKQISQHADEVAARSQQWGSISSGSPIDNYLLNSLSDPILSDYKTVRAGGSLSKPFHNTRLRQAVNKALDSYDDFDYSSGNIDKLVSSFAAKQFNYGGLVQKFNNGRRVRKPIDRSSVAYKRSVQNRISKIGNIREFGLVALQSGLKESSNTPKVFSENHITPNSNTPVQIRVGLLSRQNAKQASDIENIIKRGYVAGVKRASKILASSFGSTVSGDETEIQKIIDNAGFYNVIGAGLEAAIGLSGANFFAKNENTKAIDFPLGLGKASVLFGDFPSNIPTDVTRTVGGYGKGIGAILAQAERYLTAESAGLYGKSSQKGVSPLLQTQLSSILGSDFDSAKTANDILQANNIGLRLTPKNLKGISRQTTLAKLFSTTNDDVVQQLIQKFTPISRNSGGNISGEDTVPALLTPGEFVFNKKAAERIGYGTLNRLNKADKIQGFNKGGFVGVQKFSGAGLVRNNAGQLIPQRTQQQTQQRPQKEPIDKAAVVAAITSILLPEAQKLAASFAKLEGSAAETGAALGGMIREASSMVLSAGIALQTVGASKKQIAIGQVIGGVGGGISGALTDYSAKAMEKALIKNTEYLGKFNKNLDEYNNAQTEELKLEAGQRLEKSFFELDSAIKASIPSINSLEQMNKFGEVIGSVTQTTLSLATAFIALRTAVTAQELTSGGQAVGGIGAAAGTLAKSPITGIIASVLLVAVAGYQIYSAYNQSLKQSGIELDKLTKALEETTKRTQDFGLTNQRYTTQVLPMFDMEKFNQLKPAEQTRVLRTIGTFDIGNEFNLLFREQFRSHLLNRYGLNIPENITMQQARTAAAAKGEKTLKNFDEAAGETRKILTRSLFRKAKLEEGLDEKAIEEFLATFGEDSDEIARVAEEYAGRFAKNKIVADQLALANNNLKISLLSLNNVLHLTERGFQQILTNVTNKFSDLDRTINILTSKEPVTPSGEIFRRDIQTLENLPMARTETLDAIFGRAKGLLGINQGTKEDKFLTQLLNQTKGLSIIERDLGLALTALANNPDRTGDDVARVVESTIAPSIRAAMPEDVDTANKLIAEVKAAIESGQREKRAPLTVEEIGGIVTKYVEDTNKGLEIFRKILDSAGKTVDLFGDQMKKLYGLQQELINLQIQRVQSENQNRVELKRALGQYVGLRELNQGFMDEMSILTESIRLPQIPGLNTGGIQEMISTSPEIIGTALMAARSEQMRLSEIEKQRPLNQKEADRLAALNPIVGNLTKAMMKLADSGTRLRDVLDKLAQSEGLDKTKRNMLMDLFTNAGDPTKMLEFQGGVRALNLFVQGAEEKRAISIPEAQMVGQNMQFIGQILPPEILDEYQRKFLSNVLDTNKIGDPELRKRVQEWLEKGSPQTQALKSFAESIANATSRTNKFLEFTLQNALNTQMLELAKTTAEVNTQFKNMIGKEGVVGYISRQEEYVNATPISTPRPIARLSEQESADATSAVRQVISDLSGQNYRMPNIIDRIGMSLFHFGIAPNRPIAVGTAITEKQAARLNRTLSENLGSDSEIDPKLLLEIKAQLIELLVNNSQANLPLNIRDPFDQAVAERINAAIGAIEPYVARALSLEAEQARLDDEWKRDEKDRRAAARSRAAPLSPTFPPLNYPPLLPANPERSGRPAPVPNIIKPPTVPSFRDLTPPVRSAIPQPPPGTPPLLPVSLDSSKFDTTVDRMVNAFNDPNGGINKLITSVESLGSVTTAFTAAVEDLKKTIPNGIVKVEQNIKSEIDVSIPQGVDINASSMRLAQSDSDKLSASIASAVQNGIGSMFGFSSKG